MNSNDSAAAYEEPESLWELIKQNVKECELDIIKSAIGESLVDTSIELHEEVNTLLDIWRDYRDETTSTINYLIQSSTTNKHALPEPPDQRERLIKEINFFLKQLREKCDAKAFRNQLSVKKHNLGVINYVLEAASSKYDDTDSMNMIMGDGDSSSRLTPKYTHRPVSSMSKSGLATPCMKTFRSQNNCSKMSSTLEIVEDKLNCMDIDDIAEHLREVLQEEIDQLLKDIDFLYECLDKESDYRLQSNRSVKEPTLTELKEERKRLEDDILVDSSKQQQQRPSSNNSISSISLSIKSPSPTPLIKQKSVVAEPPRTKLPLTLTSLTGVNKDTNTSSKLRSESVATNKTTTTSPIKTAASSSSSNSNTFTLKTTRTVVPLAKTTTTTARTTSINRSSDNLASSTASSPTPSSASSRTSSVSSLIRSKILVPPVVNSTRQNAAEKFRKMVLESRDT